MAADRMGQHWPATPPTQPSAPPAAAPPQVPAGFAVCPLQVAQANAWQQEIYRLAYERAQEAVRVPRFHRMLFSVWN